MAKKFDLAALMGEAVSKSDTGEMRVEQIPLVESRKTRTTATRRPALTSWRSPSR